jgi:outer membrane protein
MTQTNTTKKGAILLKAIIITSLLMSSLLKAVIYEAIDENIKSYIGFQKEVRADYIGFEISYKTMNIELDALMEHASDDGSVDEKKLGLKETTLVSIEFLFDHPMPIIPNIKINTNSFIIKGAPSNITWAGEYQAKGSTAKIDLTHNNYLFYYRYFEDNIIRMHLGVGIISFNGLISITNASRSSYVLKIDNSIPSIYSQLEATIAGTNILSKANIVYTDNKGYKVTEYNVGFKYTHKKSSLGTEVGYKLYSLEIVNKDSVDAKFEISGFYYGFHYQF